MERTIDMGEYNLNVRGSNKGIKIDYAKPEWSEYQQTFIRYQNMRYYLSEVENMMPLSKENRFWRGTILGKVNYTYSSGIMITYSANDDCCYVYYWWISSKNI